MTHASVFSGIGGPEVAATMLGWQNLFHCEINPFGRQVLDYWYPEAESYEDITTTDFTRWRGRVDVLTGGFPCQPFSYAGQRRGQEDDRYLWPYMFRCIDQIRPTWVIAENVAGILTMVEQGEVSQVASARALFDEGDAVRGQYRLRETFTLQRICDDLEGHGYSVQPVLIPACSVGAPHRRDRVFIVGHRVATDPDHRTDRRAAGAHEGESRQERLQERNEVREFNESNQVRPATGRHAPHASDAGFEGLRRERQDAVHRPIDAAHPDGHRGSEVDEHVESQVANGAEPVSNGGQRNVADTSEQPSERLRPEQPETGRAQQEQSGGGSGEDGSLAGCGRWSDFPSVSPVHRGNDGLPFPVDDLAIPFSKWRTESLKAYGNAIVPAVMYEIFRAIEIVEKGQNT